MCTCCISSCEHAELISSLPRRPGSVPDAETDAAQLALPLQLLLTRGQLGSLDVQLQLLRLVSGQLTAALAARPDAGQAQGLYAALVLRELKALSLLEPSSAAFRGAGGGQPGSQPAVSAAGAAWAGGPAAESLQAVGRPGVCRRCCETRAAAQPQRGPEQAGSLARCLPETKYVQVPDS